MWCITGECAAGILRKMPSFCPGLVRLIQKVVAIKVEMKKDSQRLQNLFITEEHQHFYSCDLSLPSDYTNYLQ